MARSRLTLAELTALVPLDSLVAALAVVPDPRGARARLDLTATLALMVCAMLCGARSFHAVEQWTRAYGPAMARALGFRRPIAPSQGTLLNLFQRMGGGEFEAMLAWWARRQGVRDEDVAALDLRELEGQHGDPPPRVSPRLISRAPRAGRCAAPRR
jgi:hypothetical protein